MHQVALAQKAKGGGAIKGNGGYLEYNAKNLQRPDLLKKNKSH